MGESVAINEWETFVVLIGYEGAVWIEGLKPSNRYVDIN